jgi:hypothetical protein
MEIVEVRTKHGVTPRAAFLEKNSSEQSLRLAVLNARLSRSSASDVGPSEPPHSKNGRPE